MTTYRTGNAIGSADPRDLYDNAENLDEFVNSKDKLSHPDRLGVSRKTWHGMEQEFDSAQYSREARFNDFISASGYQFLGDYAAGLEFTEYNQLVRDENGEFWRLSGQVELPYTTTGSGIPEGDALVPAGDAVLRQDLANPDKGAAMVGFRQAGDGAVNRTALSKMRDHISDRDFGAAGDGVRDDTDSLNAALQYLRDIGGGTLDLSPGAIIRITAPLRVFSGTIIRGNGATIIASEVGWADTVGRGMLELVAVRKATVRDLTLDHNCSGHSNPRPAYCALLLASNDNTFENVVFSDSGSDTSLPSGPQVHLVAKDIASERSGETPPTYSEIVGPCSRNTFKDCTFELPKTAKVAFGVRVVTDWEEQRPIDSFTNHAEENKFEGCRFYGDYRWNMLELAGGGTRDNVVSGCFFRGEESLTAIDFDKGANYNIAIGNIVEGIGRPDSYINDPTTRLVAINVHGNPQYLSVGNIVANNIIRGVGNPEDQDVRQGAIGVTYATDTTVNGNHIENVNNGLLGAGISIGHGVDRLLITGNTIREVRSGVADNLNSTSLGLVTLANNQITALSTCILMGGGGENSGITLTGNSLEHVGESLPALSVGSDVTHCTITSNFLSGGSDTVTVAANRNTLIGNTIRGAAARGIRVSGGVDNLLLGNTVEDSGIGDYIASGADTATPTLIGNSFSHSNSFRKAPTITYGTEAPTSGSWTSGDRVQNENPKSGGVLGWICLSGGTPGTWAAYGNIE